MFEHRNLFPQMYVAKELALHTQSHELAVIPKPGIDKFAIVTGLGLAR